MRASSTLAFLASLILPTFVMGAPLALESSKRDMSENATSLTKRYSNARLTWFDDSTGIGACGVQEEPYDLIVALNADQYGDGSSCWKTITINYNGNYVNAQIADMCPGCPYGGLDLSVGTFQALADLGAGVIYGEWDFQGGSSPPPATTTAPYSPPYTPPATTTNQPQTTATTTTTSTPSTKTTDAAVVAASVGTPIAADSGSLAQLQLAFVGIGSMVADARSLA